MASDERAVRVFAPRQRRLPPLPHYLREMWSRRDFVAGLAQSDLRAQHYETAFGQLWNLLNPLLMAAAYLVLLEVVSPTGRTSLQVGSLILGLFVFQFFSYVVSVGAGSIVRGGRLVLNAAFPRAVLPLSSAVAGAMLLLPELAVYALVHLVLGLEVGWTLLWLVVPLALVAGLALGVTMFYSALAVEVRDAGMLLPHLLRYWLYVTPVLYRVEEIPESLRPYLELNPLFPAFETLQRVLAGEAPAAGTVLVGGLWAVGSMVLGLLFFANREDHFGVQL